MPIDTSLYRILQPPERKDPFTQLSQMANAQTAIHQLKTAQQQQADQAAIRQAWAESGGNTEAALARLRAINPAAAFDLETQIAGQQKATRDAQRAEGELQQRQLETGLRALHAVKDDRTFQIARRRIRSIDPEVADLLGETYDQATVDNVIRLSLSAKDALAGPTLHKVRTVNAQGQEVDKFVEPTPGAEYVQPSTAAKGVTLGSFEDYVTRYAAGKGKTPETLTPADIEDARKRYQQADDRPITVNTGAQGALPPRVETTVRSLATAFRNEPSVKRTVTMGEAVSFVNGLDVHTKNPADDQALIYAFAKAMDPESVVREGEYATVQKYATSWLERFGFDAMRVLSSNTPILTASARSNLKQTITSRYQATRTQYDNLAKSYAGQINKATGGQDGSERLTDYAAVLPPGAETAGGGSTSGGGGPSFGGSYQDYLRRQQGKK
jgi:hypothetical protein